MESLLDIYQRLTDRGYRLSVFESEDESALYAIFREVVDSGSQFPYESSSIEEFRRQFLRSHSEVYVCHSNANDVVGGFYLRSNFPGRSDHIANAAYMLRRDLRGQGIGTLLIKSSLYLAKRQGFKAMQFNLVLSQNKGAATIYQRLGFHIAGTLPNAVRNPDGSYQDGYVMFRNLEDLIVE